MPRLISYECFYTALGKNDYFPHKDNGYVRSSQTQCITCSVIALKT